MAANGMVRADQADFSALAGNGNGNGMADGKRPHGAEIEEDNHLPHGIGGGADVLDENDDADWVMDMSKVLCTNLLASGAFGKVFHGLYNQNDVAVKLMNLPPNMSAKDLAGLKSSFKQEIAVWHKLKHKNIVEFVGASLNANNIVAPHDVMPPAGQPLWAIVTEYMPGGTLRGFLTKRKRLSTKDVLRFALDIARGLEYLHAHDIVHRDLKSDNLLMDHKNVVKIADFGVARTEAKNPVDMTCETGTVRWMAPEVIEHKPYNRKVDVYSFGIVLWELCTSELPFKDLTFVQLAYNVVNKDERPPIPDSCNPALAALMRECWDKDPDKRPDFPEVVQRLEAVQQEVAQAPSDSKSGGSGCCTVQ